MSESIKYEELNFEVDGSAAVITLNRPEALNALTNTMLSELKHAFAAAEQDQNVVGIVLTGAGRGFCAGMDMNNLSAQSKGDSSGGEKRRVLDAEPGDKSMGDNFKLALACLSHCLGTCVLAPKTRVLLRPLRNAALLLNTGRAGYYPGW